MVTYSQIIKESALSDDDKVLALFAYHFSIMLHFGSLFITEIEGKEYKQRYLLN